jgi:GT2 family glycosyltransferase
VDTARRGRPSGAGALGMSGAPGLTAAICTRGRPELLARALDSLVAQVPAVAEILVVDNAPGSDATRSLVATRFPSVRYVIEPIPGLDFARNRALEVATREVVAFLDDDAVAAPEWAQALHRVFDAEKDVAICTGRVEALNPETPAQILFEANGGFSRGTARIRLPDDAGRPLGGRRAPLIAWALSVGCGCSYAVRRCTARALGGFDEALDLGPALPGGGDHDLLWRALSAGHAVVYEPEALAWHEHRRELDAVHDQIVGHQRAVLAFLAKHLGRWNRSHQPALLAYTGWRLAKPGVRLLRRAMGRDPLPAVVLARMWWNCWLGLLAYPVARRLAQGRREAAR